MIVDCVCVYDDGSRPFAPELSPDQRRALRIFVGDDVTIRVRLINPLGAPIVLGAGEYLAWYAKTSGSVSKKLVSKQSTGAAGAGLYTITLVNADTRALEPQRAVHDLWAIRGAARVCVVPLSELVIARSGLGAVPP